MRTIAASFALSLGCSAQPRARHHGDPVALHAVTERAPPSQDAQAPTAVTAGPLTDQALCARASITEALASQPRAQPTIEHEVMTDAGRARVSPNAPAVISFARASLPGAEAVRVRIGEGESRVDRVVQIPRSSDGAMDE
jgi:hypothetical protein